MSLDPVLLSFPNLFETIPSAVPSAVPSTLTPTVQIQNALVPQLMHRWAFNEKYPEDAMVHDDISGTDAQLKNGVAVHDGKAVFKYKGADIPYIKLPFAALSGKRVVTIESWVTFESSNNASSTLFSFAQVRNLYGKPVKALFST